MAQPYLITGAADTGVHPRLEIRDLQKKNPIQFSLFIQAMNKLANMNDTKDPQSKDYYNKPNSWWQMGTIHGMPYNQWSGDPDGPQKPASDQWEGYCYHAASLFPTWHRVQVLLVEQAVVNEAIAIASELKNGKWLQAAKELRFPFWDWTRQETAKEGIPKICQDPKIGVMQVDGSTVMVDNPLNHYKFATSPGAVQSASYMGKWTRTYRWADQNDQPTKEMYDQQIKAFSEGLSLTIGSRSPNLQPIHWLRGKVAALFTYDLTVQDQAYGGNMWGYFSNAGAQGDMVDPVMSVMPPSIEDVHNQVHLDIGGNGSMSFNEYAGFDPIFYLHHCNVDRLYAFWEYLYPEYWIGDGWKSTQTEKVTPFVTDKGTFYQNAGSQVNHATPLVPFRRKVSGYWTPDEVRGLLRTSPVNKYYTYPPITDTKTGMAIKVDVPYDVNNLALRERYQQILYNEFGPEFHKIIEHHREHSHLSPLHAVHADLLMTEVGGTAHLRHFYLVGEIPEFAFSGSYRLELYLLNHPETHVVNSISVLGRADPDRCAACKERRAAGNRIRGHMPLDPRLILHLVGQLDRTRLAAITNLSQLAALLHGSFGMRFVKPDGTRLAGADPSLPAHHAALDASKTPKLTLHSHVIQYNHADHTAPLKFHGHSHHGEFGTEMAWKAF